MSNGCSPGATGHSKDFLLRYRARNAEKKQPQKGIKLRATILKANVLQFSFASPTTPIAWRLSPNVVKPGRSYSLVRAVNIKVILVAACALVDADGRVLIAERPAGRSMAGLWEFPGGKVEEGETPEASLIRELKEELGIVVKEACLAPLTFASHTYPDFHLLMPLYVCRRWEGTVQAQEGQRLAWVRPNKLRDYPMPPADLPLISHLTTLL